MPVAAKNGTDIITKIVPIRPPIWHVIRPSQGTTWVQALTVPLKIIHWIMLLGCLGPS